MSDIIGSFGPLVGAFIVVLGIMWFVLPFYIIGISGNIKKNNELLKLIGKELRKQNGDYNEE